MKTLTVKDACPACGDIMKVSLERKKSPVLCYYVKCGNCGRESAKHIEPEEAIRDWRFNRAEEADNGPEG